MWLDERFSMHPNSTATIGRLIAMIAFTVTVGLAGCGNENSDGFQEYASTDSTDPVLAPGEAAPSTDPLPRETQMTSRNRQPMLAYSEPPVEAPLPNTTIPVTAIDEGTTDAVTAPVPTTDNVAKTKAGTATANTVISSEPLEVKVLVKERSFQVVGPDEAIRVTFDDIDLLKVINMDPVTAEAPNHMPKWQKELNGKRIRIRGYMYTSFLETGLKAFLIARDLQACCFGSDAKLYDRFLIRMRKGVTTDYLFRTPFDVVGVFRIEPVMLDGELYQIYQIDDAIIIKK